MMLPTFSDAWYDPHTFLPVLSVVPVVREELCTRLYEWGINVGERCQSEPILGYGKMSWIT